MSRETVLSALSGLYGESETPGRRIVHIQEPTVQDHWSEPGNLALSVLGIDARNFRIVRSFWKLPADDSPIDWKNPDLVLYV